MKLYLSLLALALSSTPVRPQCTDVANWKDTDGFGCAWYEVITGTDDFYYYADEQGVSRCEVYGSCCYNGGHTAVTACCACGGGSDFAQCSDVTINGAPWVDADGEGCADYDPATNPTGDDPVYYDEGDTYCSYFGDGYANAGYTAQQACCKCGGGVRSAPTPPAPTPPPPTPPPPTPPPPTPPAPTPPAPTPPAPTPPAPTPPTTPTNPSPGSGKGGSGGGKGGSGGGKGGSGGGKGGSSGGGKGSSGGESSGKGSSGGSSGGGKGGGSGGKGSSGGESSGKGSSGGGKGGKRRN